jgi:ATP-dependent Clp protease ATP-binding subunit ClpC
MKASAGRTKRAKRSTSTARSRKKKPAKKKTSKAGSKKKPDTRPATKRKSSKRKPASRSKPRSQAKRKPTKAKKTKKGSAKRSAAKRSRTRRPTGRKRRTYRSPLESPMAAQILLHLEDLMHSRILGKDDAVERVASALRIRLTHLDFRPERPNGAFLMVGPPGVGKNEFAYALADILYGDETTVVPIDMRTITSEEDVSRLSDTVITGPSPVLLEGVMTTPIRRRPHSILLLKGIEHAHPFAHRIIQQIISQGWIEDARGRVSFEHTIIFATSRVPEDEDGPTTKIGFTQEPKSFEERVHLKLAHKFGEEFVEAFEEVIVLPALTPEDVRRIARYKVDVVLKRLEEGRRGVEVSDSVFQTFISDEEASRAGAGMLTRTLESKLLNPLARYLLKHPKDRQIRVDVRNGCLVIESTRSGPVAIEPRGRLRA